MFGNDLYPKTRDQCLTMLNRCVDNVPCTPCGPPHQPPVGLPVKQEDEALVFAQGADNDKPTKGKPKNDSSSKSSSSSRSVSRGTKYRMVICKTCGQQGHVSSVCPQKKPLSKYTPWLPHQMMPRSPVRMTASLSWLKLMKLFCHHNASHMLRRCVPRLLLRVPVLLLPKMKSFLPKTPLSPPAAQQLGSPLT